MFLIVYNLSILCLKDFDKQSTGLLLFNGETHFGGDKSPLFCKLLSILPCWNLRDAAVQFTIMTGTMHLTRSGPTRRREGAKEGCVLEVRKVKVKVNSVK